MLRIIHELRQLQGVGPQEDRHVEDLLQRIVDVGSPENLRNIGALKVFSIPNDDDAERKNALGRFRTEVQALKELDHPAILKLVDWNFDETWMVTEYHPGGTLEHSLDKYRGHALESLLAFRPLVEAVSAIHKKNAIHRDIKLKNIFVANDGRLVLGDFEIVIFEDAPGGRLTETYERVGTRDWMAPWANTEHRLALAEVNPTLDIFPLGKVLWCMISGRRGLEFWYHDRAAKGNRPANNLEHLFIGDPAIKEVNVILAKCIVDEEERCLQSANELLALVDNGIERIRRLGQKPESGDRWLCLVCKKGYYSEESWRWSLQLATKPQNNNHREEMNVFFCDHCGHMQAFRTGAT